MTDDDAIRRVVIHGRVQGVGYRAWTERAARQRGLRGWVRNRRDGTVEAVFAGAIEDVASMVEACRRGPTASHIDHVDVAVGSAADLTGDGFTVLPTV